MWRAKSIELCKCSGKYIDIYFNLKITCSSCSLALSFLPLVLSCCVFRLFLPVFFSCVLMVIVSLAFSYFVSLFWTFSCLSCVFPASFLPSGLFPCFSSSTSFLRHQLHVNRCLSFYLVLVFSPPSPAFLGSPAIRFCCGVCFSSAIPAVAPPLLYPSVFTFPHAVVRAAPCGLPQRFSAFCGYV